MKKIIFKTIILTAIVSLGTLTSCKKKGCTNSEATNYSEDAKKDDGTCAYKGTVSFYLNQAASSSLITDGIMNVKLKVNGDYIGTLATSYYFDSTPSCSTDGTLSFSKDFGTEKTYSVAYKILSETDEILWENSISINPNCTTIELEN